jgi:dihydroorotase
MMSLFSGARVIDPCQGLDDISDILVKDGKVAAIGRDLASALGRDVEKVDLRGYAVVPGLIDPHVHFRDPGQEHKETVISGCASAAAGGYTSVIAMANTSPAVDSVETLNYVLEKGKGAPVRFCSVGSVTLGLKGEVLSPMDSLAEAGAVAFSDDGFSIVDSEVMYRAFEKAAELGLPISVHCEDPRLWGDRTMNRGALSDALKVKGVPKVAEEAMIQRDILLASKTKAKVHIQHVSTALGVEMIRRAKEDGIEVTSEATPHHLILTEEVLSVHGSQAKMSPPLREARDVEALREGLRLGIIDVIATDHAPHSEEEKGRGLLESPNGIVGLETAVPMILTELVGKGHLSINRMVEAMSCASAEIFGLPGGSLRPGCVADMTVLDLEARWTIDADRFESKGRNTPFDGAPVVGAVIGTVLGGLMQPVANK